MLLLNETKKVNFFCTMFNFLASADVGLIQSFLCGERLNILKGNEYKKIYQQNTIQSSFPSFKH